MPVKKQFGFAMIEALVTALIVAIGISGAGVLLMRAIQGTQDSGQQSQAMWIVQDLVGRMRANSPATRAGDYVVDAPVNCEAQPTMCSAYSNNSISTSGNTPECTSAEMAVSDIWLTVCGIDDDIKDSPSEFIVQPTLISECTIPDAEGCLQYNITLNWLTKLPKGSSVASERTSTNSFSIIVEVN